MKNIYFFIFLLLLSCTSLKKEYVCGDRPCVDKKEFNQFFAETLTIEVTDQSKKKQQSIDLVKLNTNTEDVKENKNSIQQYRIQKKKNKEKLKFEKKKLNEERKIKAAEEKIKIKESRKIQKKLEVEKIKTNEMKNKLDQNSKEVENIIDKTIDIKTNKKKMSSNDSIQTDSVESTDPKSICDEIEDCDIDKIAEILVEKGKVKPFPNISSN